jgi:hypothetical protein
VWANENLPQDAKVLTWYLHAYYLEREYQRVNPAWQGVLDFSKIKDAPTFLRSIKELGITHLLYQTPGCYIVLHAQKLIERCVTELIESGRVIMLKDVGKFAIYSLTVPPDYFALDGNTIRFYDESQRKYLVKGWASAEEWGAWSEGEESLIIINFKDPKDYTMLIKAKGSPVPGREQNVRIYFDDNLLSEWTFTNTTTTLEDFEVKIPSAYIKEGNQRIRFVYSYTGSPTAEHGSGPDSRQLAMGVSSIVLK